MPCGRKQQTRENSFFKSVICVKQGQGERPCYHRSSVVSCCDGAEPLLPGSVPENDYIVYHLYFTFVFLRKAWTRGRILLTKFAALLVFLPALLF